MAVTAAEFREALPEFSDVTAYPDSQLEFWLVVGAQLVNEDRWGDLASLGIMLVAAHNVVLGAADQRVGAIPGAALNGLVSSKSVGGVSVGIDVSTPSEQDAGHWNLTTYGTRYIRFSRMFGAGPVQVGTPDSTLASASAAAWPGPYLGPW